MLWAVVRGSFTSRLLEIRFFTEVMPLALKGREEVNHKVPLLGETVSVSLAEMTAGLALPQPGFKGVTMEIWE